MNNLTRKAAILYLILVFLAGGVAGGAARYYYAKQTGAVRPPPPRGGFKEFIMSRLTEELKLTTNQVAAITPIVSTNFARMDALRKEMDEQFNEVFAQMNEQ